MHFQSSNSNNLDENKKVLVVIPARFGSTRLPGKMMADIAGEPLIVHTWRSVVSSKPLVDVADVLVACDDQRIANAVKGAGGDVIMTPSDLPSGTDRVYAAYELCGRSSRYEAVVNVQGDMPFVEPEIVEEAIKLIGNSNYDISTIATTTKNVTRQDMYKQEQVVNPVIAFSNDNSEDTGKALYFSRSPVPFGGPFYKHIGVYGFHINTLKKFVSLPQSSLERSERLEQLRALENGMSIGIKVLNLEYPISVDTPEDLENARKIAESRTSAK